MRALRGDQHVALALAAERLADDLLGDAGGIDIGGVDEVDAGIDAEVDLPARVVEAGGADLGKAIHRRRRSSCPWSWSKSSGRNGRACGIPSRSSSGLDGRRGNGRAEAWNGKSDFSDKCGAKTRSRIVAMSKVRLTRCVPGIGDRISADEKSVLQHPQAGQANAPGPRSSRTIASRIDGAAPSSWR